MKNLILFILAASLTGCPDDPCIARCTTMPPGDQVNCVDACDGARREQPPSDTDDEG